MLQIYITCIKKIETSWMNNKCPGEQWLQDFCKRYNDKLSYLYVNHSGQVLVDLLHSIKKP